MPRWTACLAGCLAAVTLAPPALHGQAPRALTLDATLGAARGFGGGEVRARGGVALDGLLAGAFRVVPGRALVAGVSASFQGTPWSDDVCYRGSRGQCLTDFPMISTIGALAGWERRGGTGRSAGATARLLAGPAYVHMDGDDSAGQRGSTAGLLARLDLATPHLGPFAIVGSLRGTAVPRFRGQSYGVWAAGLGVRLR